MLPLVTLSRGPIAALRLELSSRSNCIPLSRYVQDISLSVSIYIYICVCVCVCVYEMNLFGDELSVNATHVHSSFVCLCIVQLQLEASLVMN